MMCRNNTQKEKGVALYLTIIVMALLLAMIFGLGLSFVGQVKLLRGVGHSMVVLYAAEAGLESALYQDLQGMDITLCDGTGGAPTFCQGTFLNEASYEILVQLPGGDCTAEAYCVESRGELGQSARALRISVDSVGFGCIDQVDVMLVLDSTGSISDTDPDGPGPLLSDFQTLKEAAKAFVDILSPSSETAHIGQSNFEEIGVLDLPLSSDLTAIKGAINALVREKYPSSGTNLKEGIDVAKVELGGGNDRLDVESPDFMLIITDGEPNIPAPTSNARAVAKVAADEAKAASIEIFVVGVGTNGIAETFLRDNIAHSPTHYFDIDAYADLEEILEELATCG